MIWVCPGTWVQVPDPPPFGATQIGSGLYWYWNGKDLDLWDQKDHYHHTQIPCGHVNEGQATKCQRCKWPRYRL